MALLVRLFDGRSKLVQATARGAQPPQAFGLSLPLFPLAFSSLGFPLFFFVQQRPPARQRVAPLRQDAFDDGVHVHASRAHPLQDLLLQFGRKRVRLLQLEDLLLPGSMLCQPGVLQDVGQRGSQYGPLGEQALAQLLGQWREVVRVLGLLLEDSRLGDGLVVVVKGQLADEEGVQDDAQTPDVDLFAGVLFALEHLGGAVAHGAAPGLQVVALALVLAGEAKVDELYVFVLVEQDVLELEVAVHAGLAVDVRDGADELGEDALDLGGLEGAVREEVVVQLIAWAVS